MLEGRLGNTSGAPYVEARVSFPRLGIRGLVSFLVDTGADGTVFMPTDSKKLGVDFGDLRNPITSDGIGGSARGYVEEALLSFSDHRFIYSYLIEAQISAPAAHNSRFPSLLGRDILRHWRSILDPARNKVAFTPRSWGARSKI
jgi:Aspartyl protease